MSNISDSKLGEESFSRIPGLTPVLVERLEQLFPERCPSLNDTERVMFFYAGKRDLIKQLRTILIQQQREQKQQKYDNRLMPRVS